MHIDLDRRTSLSEPLVFVLLLLYCLRINIPGHTDSSWYNLIDQCKHSEAQSQKPIPVL